MYVGKNSIMDNSGKSNYIFSSRNVTKPKRKIFGKSSHKKQIIERDGRIYTVWDIFIENSYFLGLCYKSVENSKLKQYKNIK